MGWFKEENNPKHIVGFEFELPTSLSTPEGLKTLKKIIATNDSNSHPSFVQALEDNFSDYKKQRGETTTDVEIDTGKYRNQFIEHNPEMDEDFLLTSFPRFLFEAAKNTYDSVIIRNYLSAFSPDELKEHEPLVWEVLNGQTIKPVETVKLDVQYQLNSKDNISTLSIVDNGCGQKILDAFKYQHSANHRARVGEVSQYMHHKEKFDDAYDLGNMFSTLGLKTGGIGKGNIIENKVIEEAQSIGGVDKQFTLREGGEFGVKITYECAAGIMPKSRTLQTSDSWGSFDEESDDEIGPITPEPISFDEEEESDYEIGPITPEPISFGEEENDEELSQAIDRFLSIKDEPENQESTPIPSEFNPSSLSRNERSTSSASTTTPDFESPSSERSKNKTPFKSFLPTFRRSSGLKDLAEKDKPTAKKATPSLKEEDETKIELPPNIQKKLKKK